MTPEELAAKLAALTEPKKDPEPEVKEEVKEPEPEVKDESEVKIAEEVIKTPLQEKQEILKEFELESNIPINHRYWNL